MITPHLTGCGVCRNLEGAKKQEKLYNREKCCNRGETRKGRLRMQAMEKNILVVDDQPGIRFLLDEVFTNEGYQVTTANTGKEAIDQIHARKFDLIMLDYKLPVMDGLEVLCQMEKENINLPAILMSGLAEEIKEGEVCRLVKHILAKPFNIMDVCKLVNDILEK